jgi:hypothetical protein
MANIIGTQTVNGIWIVNTDTNPTLTGGVDAPIGSFCIAEDGSGFFYKFGASNTNWEQGTSTGSISGFNVLLVRKNPTVGQYATIEGAINAIVAPSDTNRWLILVGVGQFTENTLVLPNYTSVIGASIQTTQIFPATSTQHIWELGVNNELSFMWLEGAGSGYSAIHVNDSGNYSQAHKVTFNDNDINILVESATQDTFFYGEYLDFNGDYSYGLKIIATNGFRAFANIENYYNFPTGATASICNYISGVNSDAHLLAGGCEGVNIGTAFYLQDGANMQLTSFNINNLDKGIHNPNIGSACNILVSGVVAENIVTYDIQIENLLTDGTIGGTFDDTKISLASSLVGLLIQDTDDGSLLITNKLKVLFNDGTITNVSSLLIEGATMGVEKGGTLSDGGGFVVDVLAGNGYFELFPDVDVIKRLDWNNTSITLSANVNVFIYFNNNGTLVSNGAQPDTRFNILLGRVVTNGTGIEFIDATPLVAEHTSNLILNNLREAVGSIYANGSIVTENATPLNLDVTGGEYYYGETEFRPSGGTGITFTSVYGQGTGVITGQTAVNNTQYDVSGTLTALTAGYYAKGSLYLIGDGANEKYYFVFAEAEYSTLLAVQQADIPLPPNTFSGSMVLIAGIIIQEGNANIVQVIDQRPIIGFRSFGVTASADHLSLLNLNGGVNGDGGHTNMFTVNGAKAMTGNMDMGTNNIFNAGTFNSVVVEAHASRHLPNGLDPLTTAAPTTNLSGVSTNAVGIQNSFSRSDHSHAITGAALTKVDDTNVTLSLGGSPTSALLNAASLTLGWTGTLSETRGGTAQSTYTEGDILYASAANTLSKLPIGSAGAFLRSSGTTVSWSTTTFPNAATAGDLIYASSLNNFDVLPVGTNGQVLKVVAGVPTWSTDIVGTGTVTSVSVVTANGISGSVATATTTPAITLTLGAITPTTVNGNTFTTGTGTLTLSTFTLTVAGTSSISGTNTGDQTITLTGDVTGSGTGSFATTIGAGKVTNAMLVNSSVTINGTSISLGASGTVTAAAGTLTGTTLNATVVSSSLTSVGTLISGSTGAGFTIALSTSTVTGTLAATNGGTGQSVYTVGDLLYANTTTTLAKLADVATGNALISGGVGVTPSYGKIGLTTHISGTLAIGNGGTGQVTAILAFNALSPLTTKGDIITHDGTNNIRQAIGSNTQVLIADSAQASGNRWGDYNSSILSPAAFAATQNNYNPAGLADANVLRLTSTGAQSITGIVAPSTTKTITIFNIGASNITLTDASASSVAANRFQMNGNIILGANEGVILWYDVTTTRWRAAGKAI